jgi:peptide/nickel transport system substrate-binding protein
VTPHAWRPLKGERAHIEFRGLAPKQRDEIVKVLGAKATVQESPWDCILLVTMNHEKKPFADQRVRRALTLALDRYEGSRVLSQIAIVKEVAGVQVPGTPYATPPEALSTLAGYGTNIEASRQEARRLLKEAGAEGLAFTFKNRASHALRALGIWLTTSGARSA